MLKIVAYLKQLELTDAESKLYLTLLQTGPLSVRELASTTDIKRTTAYLYIDQLINKGLVMKVVKGSHKLVAANPPESLKTLVAKQVESAETAKKQFNDIMTLISSKMHQESEIDEAEIRYNKGLPGVVKVYNDALAGTEFRLYVNLGQLDKLIIPNNMGMDYDLFEHALEKNKDLKIYEIIADKPGSLDQFSIDQTVDKGRYYYKYMPQRVGLTAPGILLYDNKVAIISGKDPESLHAFVLYNKDYYENSKKLFDFIWDVLPNPREEAAK